MSHGEETFVVVTAYGWNLFACCIKAVGGVAEFETGAVFYSRSPPVVGSDPVVNV